MTSTPVIANQAHGQLLLSARSEFAFWSGAMRWRVAILVYDGAAQFPIAIVEFILQLLCVVGRLGCEFARGAAIINRAGIYFATIIRP